MSELNFEEESSVPAPAKPEPKGLYKLVVSLGLAKDGDGARVVLIIVAIVAIVLAIAFPIVFG